MSLRRLLAIAAILLLFSSYAAAQRGGGGRGRPGTGDTTSYAVPWRYLEPGVAPASEPLILDWFPASRQEIEHSQLLRSRVLTDYAGQCIGLQVILPEDEARIAKFAIHDGRPVVLLVDHDDKVARRVEPDHGVLRVSDVEKALEDELNARGSMIVQQLSEARAKASSGDRAAAVGLYTKVWDQRCLFPFAAHEAQHALADLGVKVVEPPPPTPAAPATPAAAVSSAPQKKSE